MISLLYPSSYILDDNALMRAQLLNLKRQSNQRFEVVIVDSHYEKRRDEVEKLRRELKFKVVHAPFDSDTSVPRDLDYSSWNQAALLATGDHVATFLDWRFASPCFVDVLEFAAAHYPGHLIDCGWEILGKTGHSDIIQRQGNPHALPRTAANWSDERTDCYACYGNFCVGREVFLESGGIDEVFGSSYHFIDVEFATRMQNRGLKCRVIRNILWREWHDDVKTQSVGFSPAEPRRRPNDNHRRCCMPAWLGNYQLQWEAVEALAIAGRLVMQHDSTGWPWYVCPHCGKIWSARWLYGKQLGHLRHDWRDETARTTTSQRIGLPGQKLGRDVKRLAAEIADLTLEERIEAIGGSWQR